ncbi:RNA-binding protein 48 [Austrofundulus limnaeus]|uniref:RNA-binding protein 48 n=1 Tax=Austrofundulus limnaeus TaxID=52670 RepID=A0A2I4B052_AUSLI|nr:PREDICTED: RNA-binding protein 48 [Austrofundulus limnaeus]
MAAPVNNSSSCWKVPEVYKHHEQQKVCISRPKYREGRKDKAVKVYTINLESRYLMVQGVPAIGVMTELVQLCALYGTVEEYRPLDEYPAEEFTEVYLIKFQKLTSARAAKRNMDEKSFYGGVLHVCYVPEYETVEDTRLKLQDRRSYVMRAARNRAKEKKEKAAMNEGSTSSETTSTSDTVVTRHEPVSENLTTGETSSDSLHPVFPPLPLPPHEYYSFRCDNAHEAGPKEDKMGTLHNAVTNLKQPQVESLRTNPSPFNRSRGTRCKLNSNQDPEFRFLPRTKHLERRKRKMEEAAEQSAHVSGGNEPLIGPKLPEPPKLDMEDDSLNTTVSLIRNTMKQVESVPDLKPGEKKIKPRRRI